MIFFTIIVYLLTCSPITPAIGAEILNSEIEIKEGIIGYRFNANVSSNPNKVFNILADYKYLPQLNKHIKSSAQESREGKTIRIFKLEKCILNFCFDLDFEEEIKLQSNEISLIIIGDKSSFHFGKSKWIIRGISENQTEIFIAGELKPKFWIPPVIGIYFLDKVFIKQITETLKNIERKTQ